MSRVRLVLATLTLTLVATIGVLAARTIADGTSSVPAAASTTAAAASATAAAANVNGRIPEDQLVTIDTGHRLIAPAVAAFTKLERAARDAGHDLTVNSAYRDLDEQAEMIRRFGLLEDGGRAAPLGESEHGDGTSVDLTLDTEALIWMRENAPGLGFHETITDEPWHWTWSAD